MEAMVYSKRSAPRGMRLTEVGSCKNSLGVPERRGLPIFGGLG